ncbi:MAG TPA: penicillin-binding protein [Flavitalea sp.]|nr:penicillin-binding protein [Flavitalea sp.]
MYLCFLGIVIFSLIILGKVVYLQRVEGAHWLAEARHQQQKYQEIAAERGTIYSEDGSMLSTSIPFFDIYIDFAAEGLREKNGKRFRNNIDSLSRSLASLFNENRGDIRKKLMTGYRNKDRYYLLKRNCSFQQYSRLRTFPLVRLGKNKSGFIAEVKTRRLNPFGLLANRTIGLSREFIDSDGRLRNTNVGLEKTYDSLLKGTDGNRLVRFIAGGVYVPMEGYEIEPENGKDIITTLDVNIQDIAENALLKMLKENECTHGTCIVMEVKTGKIKAIANLGKNVSGEYWEDLNYAIRASEPGSTFKLASLLALLEDKKVKLTEHVNLEEGSWKVNGRTVYDSERHGRTDVTVKDAFKYSSNVGMAKLVTLHYGKDPELFVNRLKQLRLNETSGIDLVGETKPIIKNPKSKTWSATSLPWMSFGYEVLVSPLQTLMLYNAVANEGRMMKPYLLQAVRNAGILISESKPETVNESICSEQTLRLLQECLLSVCNEEEGTGYQLFASAPYKAAGKTGTALVANGNRGYGDHVYQSSFAGYFPAENPQYSCIVVIRNKPFAKKYYGAAVAGPVFKEIADKLYALNIENNHAPSYVFPIDSSSSVYAGTSNDLRKILQDLRVNFKDSIARNDWAELQNSNTAQVMHGRSLLTDRMPDVSGLGLKDALFLLENRNMNIVLKGKGKVKSQSIKAGDPVFKNQSVVLELF